MKNVLLCSSDPLLIKNVYAVLRDEGFTVDIVEHPAFAVQRVLDGAFDVLVLDSEPFGLSADDAVQIIRSVKPDFRVLCVGSECRCNAAYAVDSPIDLELFKRKMHTIAA